MCALASLYWASCRTCTQGGAKQECTHRTAAVRRCHTALSPCAWHEPLQARTLLSTSSLLLQLQTLVVDIGDIAAGYKIPGQFVQIKVRDLKSFNHPIRWHGRSQPSPHLGITKKPASLRDNIPCRALGAAELSMEEVHALALAQCVPRACAPGGRQQAGLLRHRVAAGLQQRRAGGAAHQERAGHDGRNPGRQLCRCGFSPQYRSYEQDSARFDSLLCGCAHVLLSCLHCRRRGFLSSLAVIGRRTGHAGGLSRSFTCPQATRWM